MMRFAIPDGPLSHFVTGVTVLSLCAPFTYPSPIVSREQNLHRRQRGAYWGADDDGTGHPGSYFCYRGGTWYKQADIAGLWDQACSNSTSITYDTQHFSYAPNADGSYTDQSVRHEVYSQCLENSVTTILCQDTGFEVDFRATFESANHANQSDCQWAMKRVNDVCHGKHNDTRGGWFEFQDGSTYGFDPQGQYEGKEQKWRLGFSKRSKGPHMQAGTLAGCYIGHSLGFGGRS